MRLSNTIFCGARRTAVVENFAGIKFSGAKRVGGGLLALLMSVSMVSGTEAQVAPGSSLGSSAARVAALPDGLSRAGTKLPDVKVSGAKVAKVAEVTEEKVTGKTSGEEVKKSPASGGVSEVEMARMVAALEERIRQLESRIESMTEAKSTTEVKPVVFGAIAGTSAPMVTTSAVMAATTAAKSDTAKEVVALQDEAKQNSQLLKFLKDVEINGVVDGYYSYNTNQVDMFTQGRAFDVRHNAFSLQLARIGFNKAASTDSPLGFRLDVGLGETVDRIISVSDYSRNEATKHLLQAYVSYVAPVGKGLTIDFGKMYTPVGAEVIDTKDNFNYSRGWLFTYGPYYHTGFRAKYAFNDKVALTGFLFNGWDNLYENNHNRNAGKTTGLQLSLNPTKKFALTQTYLGGPEAPLANVPAVSRRDNWRNIADTVASYLVTDKLTLTGNFVAGSDGDDAGKRGKWTGFSGYLKYAFNSRLAFSPRFEIFDDSDGLRTGTAQTVKGVTLTQEIKLVNNLLTRFEFRRDYSNRKFFTNASGTTLNHQNTFIVGLSYAFSNRDQ